MSSIAPPGHTRREVTTDSWITPQWVFNRFGPFDLDPCACEPQPWPTAARMLTVRDNGLMAPWHGYVWCNPPYGRELGLWLNRLALHGDGMALVFARTETRAFAENVWPYSTAQLWLRGRMTFCTPKGVPALQGHNSGGPSVFLAYGRRAQQQLEAATDIGAITHSFRPQPTTP